MSSFGLSSTVLKRPVNHLDFFFFWARKKHILTRGWSCGGYASVLIGCGCSHALKHPNYQNEPCADVKQATETHPETLMTSQIKTQFPICLHTTCAGSVVSPPADQQEVCRFHTRGLSLCSDQSIIVLEWFFKISLVIDWLIDWLVKCQWKGLSASGLLSQHTSWCDEVISQFCVWSSFLVVGVVVMLEAWLCGATVLASVSAHGSRRTAGHRLMWDQFLSCVHRVRYEASHRLCACGSLWSLCVDQTPPLFSPSRVSGFHLLLPSSSSHMFWTLWYTWSFSNIVSVFIMKMSANKSEQKSLDSSHLSPTCLIKTLTTHTHTREQKSFTE